MFVGHAYELIIIFIAFLVTVGGSLLVYMKVRTAAHAAALEFTRVRAEEKRRQPNRPQGW